MLTGETPLSNPSLLERETNDLTIKEAPVTQAGDDKTKKRKLKSLDSTKRSHKKRSLGDQSSGKGEVESLAMSPTGKGNICFFFFLYCGLWSI